MAEFQEVIKNYQRFCNSKKEITCDGCPIYKIGDQSFCVDKVLAHPDEAEKIIMGWAKENPPETWHSRLKKVLPECNV